MAINKKLIHFKRKTSFENETANDNILDTSICFIQDSKEISTHGTIYKTVNWSILKPELYQWVDLGLPSGTLWADRNVGATKPEDYGLYFAWGETEGYTSSTDAKEFVWDDYKFSINGSISNFSKYNSTDDLKTLDLVDDAAYVSDNTCRMPTLDEVNELTANTTSTWETLNGINGRRFTADNGKSIFIPAAGCASAGSPSDVGSKGYIWSSSHTSYSFNSAHCLDFNSSGVDVHYDYRFRGLSVRPVKQP